MRNNERKERLVLLFGDERGDPVSPVHAFVREMLWAFLWHLNHLFFRGAGQGDKDSRDRQLSFVQMIGMMMAVCNFTYRPDRASGGLLNIYLEREREKAVTLIDVANAISDQRGQVIHQPMQFDPQTGVPETPEEAAKRLLREAALHPNRFVASSDHAYAHALVAARLLSEEEAMAVLTAARAERQHRYAAMAH